MHTTPFAAFKASLSDDHWSRYDIPSVEHGYKAATARAEYIRKQQLLLIQKQLAIILRLQDEVYHCENDPQFHGHKY